MPLFAREQLSYSVGSSIYFSANNREASFNNLKEEAIKKREAALKPMHGESVGRTSVDATFRSVSQARVRFSLKAAGTQRACADRRIDQPLFYLYLTEGTICHPAVHNFTFVLFGVVAESVHDNRMRNPRMPCRAGD